MATKITTALIESDAITSAHIGTAAITNADLHTNMDLTGKTVLVANASTGDNDTTAANTAFVQQEIAALVDSSPSALNTLNELAAALGDDANFSTTVTNNIATKMALAGGTFTGNVNITKETPYLNLTDSSASRTLGVFVDDNNSVLRSSGPLLLQVGSVSAITIDSSLKVGIGTGSPAAKLNVEWTGSQVSTDNIARITAPIYPSLEFYSTNSNSSNRNWKIAGVHNSYGTLEFLRSSTAGGVANVTTLAMNKDGNIGIGTHVPEGPLHVQSATNEVMITDMTASSGTYTWMSYRRNNANKFRVFGDSNDSSWGIYNDATGSSAGYYPFTITNGNNSTGSNFVGLNTNAPAKPLHVKRTSGWATVRLEGASDSGGELEFYAGSNLKAKLWADNSAGDIYIRAGGTNTQFIIAGDGNWVGPHEDNVKRNFIGRGPFNVYDFSDHWHEFYNPAANTEHHISGSFTNAMGVTMTFPSSVTKKILQHDRTPTGSVGVIYEAQSSGTSGYNGGFDSGQFRVDPDKGYIFGYYCRRITSASNGTHYAGFSHGVSAGTGTNVDSNPYFQAFSNANLPQGVWTLHYYHLHPRYYSGTGDGGIGGVYRVDNGTRILGHTAWKQPVNQTYQTMRSYNYYCGSTSVSIQWYAPFVYEVNGHEPTPAALLANT